VFGRLCDAADLVNPSASRVTCYRAVLPALSFSPNHFENQTTQQPPSQMSAGSNFHFWWRLSFLVMIDPNRPPFLFLIDPKMSLLLLLPCWSRVPPPRGTFPPLLFLHRHVPPDSFHSKTRPVGPFSF